MIKLVKYVALITAISLSTGCASLQSGRTMTLKISNEPENIKFVIKNKKGNIVYDGTTPASVKLKKGAGYFKAEQYSVEFKRHCYPTQIIKTTASINPKYWENHGFFLVNLGLFVLCPYCINVFLPISALTMMIGYLVVDPLTGAMWQLSMPEQVEFDPQKPCYKRAINHD